jgi:thioredoxin 1
MADNFNDIISSNKPTLVDFFATWCGPCKMMNPIIEKVKNDLGDEVTVLKIDVDNNKEVSIKYGIRSVPTLILFKDGEIVWRQSGIVQTKNLIEKVQEFM